MHRKILVRLLATAVAATIAGAAGAQNYPVKPVRVLVGLGAGGGTDLLARIVTPKLAEALGQPFIVENRPGAGANIATDVVAKANPDGYTILFSPNGPMVINPTMYKTLPFSPTRDFAPIAMVATFPLIIGVNAKLPVNNVGELVGWMKANPGKANCGGSGPTFELAVRLLTSKTGTECTFITYKANSDAAQAIMTGDLHFALIDAGPIYGAIQGGRVRGLAVTTPSRDPTFPDLPSVVEAGFPELDMRFWMGRFAPAATPAPIVKRLEAETQKLLKSPDVIKAIHAKQAAPADMNGEQLSKFVAGEIPRWDAVRKAANIPQVD
jgi:tripartite-type tricarboxylate transporter receptor subunit TctC